jgi:hypothetical protein
MEDGATAKEAVSRSGKCKKMDYPLDSLRKESTLTRTLF